MSDLGALTRFDLKELPLELWKEIIEIISNPHQYWDDKENDYTMALNNYIPFQLSLLSSISKKINKICQDRLKFVIHYVGEHRIIPTLRKTTSADMFRYFAQEGYLSLIKEVQPCYQWKDTINTEDIHVNAVMNGHLDILEYWHESGWDFPKDLINIAYSSLECVKYLHEHGLEWNEECCANAATTGSLELLKYCHENGGKRTCFNKFLD